VLNAYLGPIFFTFWNPLFPPPPLLSPVAVFSNAFTPEPTGRRAGATQPPPNCASTPLGLFPFHFLKAISFSLHFVCREAGLPFFPEKFQIFQLLAGLDGVFSFSPSPFPYLHLFSFPFSFFRHAESSLHSSWPCSRRCRKGAPRTMWPNPLGHFLSSVSLSSRLFCTLWWLPFMLVAVWPFLVCRKAVVSRFAET